MSGPVRDSRAMIAGMTPRIEPGDWVFVTVPEADPALMARARAIFREAEGLSLIVPADDAAACDPDAIPMRQITLAVHSALDGVGLTAAVSGALARAGIPANVVAAFHHDHVFVPDAMADRAMDVLRAVQDAARAPC